MFEKVNPCHPDKVADRIAGAIVDLCYTKSKNPKVACEVLIGHGECTLQIETSERLTAEEMEAIVHRIAGEDIEGGSVPNDRNFLTALNYYTDLLTLNQQREDRVPDHIDAMFQERYGYHFNRD